MSAMIKASEAKEFEKINDCLDKLEKKFKTDGVSSVYTKKKYGYPQLSFRYGTSLHFAGMGNGLYIHRLNGGGSFIVSFDWLDDGFVTRKELAKIVDKATKTLLEEGVVYKDAY